MIYRRANQEDYNEIFLMGYDVWSDGLIEDEYLKNCNESEKYSQGEWWIFSHNWPNSHRLSFSLMAK